MTKYMEKSEQVKKRIEEIKAEREKQIAELEAKIKACADASKGLDAKIEAAAAAENLEAWNKATFEKSSAEAKIKMLSQKIEQIKKFDFVSKEESEKTIDALIELENELDASMSKAVLDAYNTLKPVYEAYREASGEATNIIKQWIKEIRPYYGDRFKSDFEMKSHYNSNTQKADLVYQEYETKKGTGWICAAYIARDFTEDAESRKEEIEADIQAFTNASSEKKGK